MGFRIPSLRLLSTEAFKPLGRPSKKYAPRHKCQLRLQAHDFLICSDEAIADFKATLAPLGEVKSVYRTRILPRGGMTLREYRVVFGNGTTLVVNTYAWPDGKIEQFLVEPAS